MATIIVTMEISLSDFKEYAHGSGEYNLDVILDKNLDSKVENYLNEMFPNGATIDDINDALTYDEDEIAQYCGFADWNDLEYGTDVEYEAGETELEYEDFDSFCSEFSCCERCPYKDTPDVDACRERFWDRRGEQ